MRITVHTILPLLTLNTGKGRLRVRCMTRHGWRQTATAMLRREAGATGRTATATVYYGAAGGCWGKLRARG